MPKPSGRCLKRSTPHLAICLDSYGACFAQLRPWSFQTLPARDPRLFPIELPCHMHSPHWPRSRHSCEPPSYQKKCEKNVSPPKHGSTKTHITWDNLKKSCAKDTAWTRCPRFDGWELQEQIIEPSWSSQRPQNVQQPKCWNRRIIPPLGHEFNALNWSLGQKYPKICPLQKPFMRHFNIVQPPFTMSPYFKKSLFHMASCGNHWLCSISPKSSSAFRHCRAFPQASIKAAYEILPAVSEVFGKYQLLPTVPTFSPFVTNKPQKRSQTKNHEGVEKYQYQTMLESWID